MSAVHPCPRRLLYHLRSLQFLACLSFFFFNDTATTEIYTLSLHDALPISKEEQFARPAVAIASLRSLTMSLTAQRRRSEEHTSELQSRQYLVCRLLLEKKKTPPEKHISARNM